MSLRDPLDSVMSDTAIVAAALERQLIQGMLNGFDPSEAKSVFIPLTTAMIPVSVECGPSDDWTCRFVFDLPHLHEDGTVEYRVRTVMAAFECS
jgi:hypothetical protein